MKLVGSGEQIVQHYMYDASGTITAGGTAQLLLPRAMARSYFYFLNKSNGDLVLEFGSARATCTISGGAVTSGGFTITNAGFNFTKPPIILFLGGGYPNAPLQSGQPPGLNTSYVGGAGPNFPAPSHVAKAHTTLSANAVNAIVLDDPGANYLIAPMVFIQNSDLDPNGCAVPSATVGRIVPAGGSVEFNGTCCTTDPIAVFGASTSQAFTCKYMT